jgi:hypothetical protein
MLYEFVRYGLLPVYRLKTLDSMLALRTQSRCDGPHGRCLKSRAKPVNLRRLRGRSRFVEDPGYKDGYQIENHHRSRKQHHVCNIGRRR